MQLKSPQNIISEIKSYTNKVDEDLITKAYMFALDKHGTQLRESGEPYISHPIGVASILISLKMDQDTIIAGILHDTVEDTNATIEEIETLFGTQIANIVNGVTKLSKFELSLLAEKQTENFKKLLISAASDIRVLIIKLADRLHNMRTLKFKKSISRRQFIAKETLEVYSPLAERIGIITIKDEMQDIAFMELYPDIYNSIKSRLKNLYESSEEIISSISSKLLELTKGLNIDCTISGRLKTPYSIWEKMNVRNISFDQLSDIMAFRIIVDTVPQCYQVLGIIHRNYLVVPGRFRDYISTPKNNSYQSLHTCVIGPLNKRIEVQIRTKEMHLIAEYGIAAHWDYKSGNTEKKKDTLNQKWLNKLVQVLENTTGMEEFLENSKTEISSNTIFCITPKGKIVSMPKGATVLDFAYFIHSDVGNHAVGAKINDKEAPLKTVIENGDQIEIFTDPKAVPQESWESFIITIRAKSALKKALNAMEKEQIEMIGKTNFEEFFKRHNIELTNSDLSLLKNIFKKESTPAFFFAIGSSEITMHEILESYNKLKNTKIELTQEDKTDKQKTLPIIGLPNVPILPINCCTPVPGDKIVGVVYKDRGVEIHIEECHVLLDQEDSTEAKIISLNWQMDSISDKVKYPAKLSILTIYAAGNLANIAEIIEKRYADITNLKIGEKFENFVQIQIELDVKDIAQLSMIIADLRSKEFIRNVTRL